MPKATETLDSNGASSKDLHLPDCIENGDTSAKQRGGLDCIYPLRDSNGSFAAKQDVFGIFVVAAGQCMILEGGGDESKAYILRPV